MSARYCNPSERLKVWDRLRYNERHVLDRLGHRRQSAFDRLSDTYSPSTTKSGLDKANSRYHSRGRSRPHGRGSPSKDRPRSRDCSRGVEESYDHTRSSYGTGTEHGYRSRDRNRSRYVKRGRKSEYPLSRVSESSTSAGGHWKSKSKRQKSTDEDEHLAVPCIFKEKDPFTPRIRNFKSSPEKPERYTRRPKTNMGIQRITWQARVWFDELPPESINGYKDLKATFLAYFMQQKKYVKDPIEIHNIKQRDGETIKEFMERFKVETGRIKRAPECMRLSRFMHGVNNPELTKCLNEHVPKTMEEMMISTTAFIRGEAAVAGKKKGHTSWRAQEQSKGHASERRSNFRGKLSHLIKEIKQGRDQPNAGKKEVPTKDKSMSIYMIQPWHIVTMQKVTQIFKRVSEITFPSLTTSSGQKTAPYIEAELRAHDSPIRPHRYDKEYRDQSMPTHRPQYREGYSPVRQKKGARPRTSEKLSSEAFKQLKQHLLELPLLVAPKPKEELIVYLSASHGAISAVLMTERDAVQTAVYFVSRELQGPELNYTPMEKLVLSLVFAAKRLRSVMLGEHNITYRPRTSVKGQILADFLVEKPNKNPPDTSVVETPQEPWILFTDGSSCVDGSGAGLILTRPEGTEFTYAIRFQFTASNNEAEYEALIAGLRIAAQMGVRNVQVSIDSKLVANQILGTYVAKEENMVKYLEKAKSLISGFANFSIS
ncbi:reverse transcriptase domain-containing protein [Tanacetum coccineum]